MKTRQFRRLAGESLVRRRELVVEGLEAIGANVLSLASELEKCESSEAFRAGRLVLNAAREEAGKFLVLLDVWRAPDAAQHVIARQFDRARDHLAKLVYAQIADYSIASQAELVRALASHRKELYLDGPTEIDWIFRNELLSERESALYVDLVDAEGRLEWWVPRDDEISAGETYAITLVRELLETDLVTGDGLEALSRAWREFDPHHDSHWQEWRDRTAAALSEFTRNVRAGDLTCGADFVARQWPMPMVELDVEMEPVTLENLQAERKRRHEASLDRELDDRGLGRVKEGDATDS